jgi:hypothetical protein
MTAWTLQNDRIIIYAPSLSMPTVDEQIVIIVTNEKMRLYRHTQVRYYHKTNSLGPNKLV